MDIVWKLVKLVSLNLNELLSANGFQVGSSTPEQHQEEDAAFMHKALQVAMEVQLSTPSPPPNPACFAVFFESW